VPVGPPRGLDRRAEKSGNHGPLVTSTCYLLGMNDSRLLRVWHAFADWWSFQMGTIEGWFHRTPETPEDRAIREEGERIRKGISVDRFRPSGCANHSRARRPMIRYDPAISGEAPISPSSRTELKKLSLNYYWRH
jgi:hypothetical protein